MSEFLFLRELLLVYHNIVKSLKIFFPIQFVSYFTVFPFRLDWIQRKDGYWSVYLRSPAEHRPLREWRGPGQICVSDTSIQNTAGDKGVTTDACSHPQYRGRLIHICAFEFISVFNIFHCQRDATESYKNTISQQKHNYFKMWLILGNSLLRQCCEGLLYASSSNCTFLYSFTTFNFIQISRLVR